MKSYLLLNMKKLINYDFSKLSYFLLPFIFSNALSYGICLLLGIFIHPFLIPIFYSTFGIFLGNKLNLKYCTNKDFEKCKKCKNWTCNGRKEG